MKCPFKPCPGELVQVARDVSTMKCTACTQIFNMLFVPSLPPYVRLS